MSFETATITAVLRSSKRFKNGQHPICVRITKDRKQHYRTIKGLSCNTSYWNFSRGEVRRNHPKSKEWNKIINDEVQRFRKAQDDLVQKGYTITAQRILKAKDRPVGKTEVMSLFKQVASELEEKGKHSNAQHYRNVGKQFENFLREEGQTGLQFAELDHQLLTDWEIRLRKKEVKGTTLHNYFKTLRALYNVARKRNSAPSQTPFEDFKISQFNTETHQPTITEEELQAIQELEISKKEPFLNEAQKYAVFSYYACGMNFTDMALLKWDNIEGDMIRYKREKTGRRMSAPYLPDLKEVVNYFYPVTKDKPYVFPVLDPQVHTDQVKRANRIQKVRKRLNRDLKILARRAGIKEELCKHITMYTLRHSFAHAFIEHAPDTRTVQGGLGHKTEEETHTYVPGIQEKDLERHVWKMSLRAKQEEGAQEALGENELENKG